MPGVRLLHGIHGQRSDGVDAQRLQLLAGQRLFARHHGEVLSVMNRCGRREASSPEPWDYMQFINLSGVLLLAPELTHLYG